MAILRTVISVVVGLITAFLFVVLVELFSAVVHPFPEGFTHTPEEMCRHVANYPAWILAVVIPMWGGTAFISVWLAGKIGNRISVVIVSTLLLSAIVFNVAMLPYPFWFSIGCPLVALLAVIAAARLTFGRKLTSDTSASIAGIGFTLTAIVTGEVGSVVAQPPAVEYTEVIPTDVRQIYDQGLKFLAASQSQDGTWTGGDPGSNMTQGLENAANADGSWASGGKQGAGVTAIALLAFLASGEDANFGIYSSHIRRSLRSLIGAQDANTGYFEPSMYHHGFAMLALAEAYGAVDDRALWLDDNAPRTIGQALELAVRAAITAQKSNPANAWRYAPGARDADASVTGAVIMGLLAARNAGIEVPDESIDKALAYLSSMTDKSGEVSYLNLGNTLSTSTARVSIAALAYAVARRKDHAGYKPTLRYLKERIEETSGPFGEYTLYYKSQSG